MREIKISKDRFNDMLEEICDFYCHWPVDTEDQEQLDRHCEECPLNNIDYEPYWEAKEEEKRR